LASGGRSRGKVEGKGESHYLETALQGIFNEKSRGNFWKGSKPPYRSSTQHRGGIVRGGATATKEKIDRFWPISGRGKDVFREKFLEKERPSHGTATSRHRGEERERGSWTARLDIFKKTGGERGSRKREGYWKPRKSPSCIRDRRKQERGGEG